MKNVESIVFDLNEEIQELSQLLSHHRGFRNGFWMVSIVRFMALRKYMEMYRGGVIHIESDVLISKDFPVEKFEFLKSELAYCVVSQKRAIASILYISNFNAAKALCEFAWQEARANPQTTDMLILKKYYDINENQIQILPTMPPINKLVTNEFLESQTCINMSEAFEYFLGVFDGHDIGVYFFGSDPRNKRGIQLLREPIPESFAQIKNWRLTLNNERKFVDLVDKNDNIPVYCIHMTNKLQNLFSPRYSYWSMKSYIESQTGKSRERLVLRVFLNQVFIWIKKKLSKVRYLMH